MFVYTNTLVWGDFNCKEVRLMQDVHTERVVKLANEDGDYSFVRPSNLDWNSKVKVLRCV